MTQKDLFTALGAPLANPRWSWGSVRSDGVVFLRVWQDQVKRRHDGTFRVKVTYGTKPRHQGDSLGHRERTGQVERIRLGAAVFLIICQAEDIAAVPRKVKDFDHDTVFRGGRLIKIAGEYWIELGQRIPVREAAIVGSADRLPNTALEPTPTAP